MTGFKSEWVAGFKLECMAGFIGIRTFADRRPSIPFARTGRAPWCPPATRQGGPWPMLSRDLRATLIQNERR
jgi:hypothetical protein